MCSWFICVSSLRRKTKQKPQKRRNKTRKEREPKIKPTNKTDFFQPNPVRFEYLHRYHTISFRVFFGLQPSLLLILFLLFCARGSCAAIQYRKLSPMLYYLLLLGFWFSGISAIVQCNDKVENAFKEYSLSSTCVFFCTLQSI